MHRLRREFSIKDLCRVLRVGRSTYYKHFNGKESPRTVENRTITGFMLRLYGSHSKRIGVHKTKHLLEREYGIRISIGRVYRLMKRMDLPRPTTKANALTASTGTSAWTNPTAYGAATSRTYGPMRAGRFCAS